MERKKFVSWRRVSTGKQLRSGLGLEAQKEIISYFVEREGGELIADFSECYTGTELSGCTELKKAIEYAKTHKAILVIAKSDRFRNTIEALQVYEQMGEGNIMFCDLPHTDKFTLTLFFALAEREALIVSIRTKQALSAKKARGEKLGAACERWKASWEKKTKEEKVEECRKRGASKNARYLESIDVMAFFRIARHIFPNATKDDDVAKWYWKDINTKDGNRQRILMMMKDYKAIDSMLFKTWDIVDINSQALQVKLATFIGSIRKSIARKQCY